MEDEDPGSDRTDLNYDSPQDSQVSGTQKGEVSLQSLWIKERKEGKIRALLKWDANTELEAESRQASFGEDAASHHEEGILE